MVGSTVEDALFCILLFFFFQAEDGIRDGTVTGVQTCALPIWRRGVRRIRPRPGHGVVGARRVRAWSALGVEPGRADVGADRRAPPSTPLRWKRDRKSVV